MVKSLIIVFLFGVFAHASQNDISIRQTCEEYALTRPFSKTEWKSDNSRCTSWKKVAGTDCVYEGNTAFLWERNCNSAGPCAAEIVCLDVAPTGFKEPCHAWWKNVGSECLSDDGKWEQHWARTCTDLRLKSDFCSNTTEPTPR